MKFFYFLIGCLINFRDYIFWFFGVDLPKRSDDHIIFEMRAEIIELKVENQGLRDSRDALYEAQFEGYSEAETRDLNHLMAQYAMFFSNASFDKFQTEEFLFFRKTSMQFMACAYQLGERNGDRATKSPS